jgi:HNH endonuclease
MQKSALSSIWATSSNRPYHSLVTVLGHAPAEGNRTQVISAINDDTRMPTTPLQRMMFLQGQCCFFCNRTIPKVEASIEHLVPSSAGGTDHPDNLVACCKSLNTLFGNMNVKEKIRAILKQNGKFVCPNQPTPAQPNPGKREPPSTPTPKSTNGRYEVA